MDALQTFARAFRRRLAIKVHQCGFQCLIIHLLNCIIGEVVGSCLFPKSGSDISIAITTCFKAD